MADPDDGEAVTSDPYMMGDSLANDGEEEVPQAVKEWRVKEEEEEEEWEWDASESWWWWSYDAWHEQAKAEPEEEEEVEEEVEEGVKPLPPPPVPPPRLPPPPPPPMEVASSASSSRWSSGWENRGTKGKGKGWKGRGQRKGHGYYSYNHRGEQIYIDSWGHEKPMLAVILEQFTLRGGQQVQREKGYLELASQAIDANLRMAKAVEKMAERR
ncbi:unnamed protein product [Durusdinium trenchii]|uniref:Uncharacterized protein n=1 Tax=Durusdinium trenchii TaxID=1381693 RepID=A0ABP0MT85_9DINO